MIDAEKLAKDLYRVWALWGKKGSAKKYVILWLNDAKQVFLLQDFTGHLTC